MPENFEEINNNQEVSLQEYMDLQREILAKLVSEYGYAKTEWQSAGFAEKFANFAKENTVFWQNVKENKDEAVNYIVSEVLKPVKRDNIAA